MKESPPSTRWVVAAALLSLVLLYLYVSIPSDNLRADLVYGRF